MSKLDIQTNLKKENFVPFTLLGKGCFLVMLDITMCVVGEKKNKKTTLLK